MPDQNDEKTSVIVLYNQVGEDVYEAIRQVDPATLGFEPEYPLDVATAKEEYAEIARALRRAGYRARTLNLENDLRKLERVVKRSRPDVIFNLVEFFHEDSGLESAVAGVFELYGITYTGAPPFTLQLCQRKGLTKQVLQQHGVPTPRFEVLRRPEVPKTLRLRYPLIVKPAWEDASSGVGEGSVVYDRAGLARRIEHVHAEFAQPLLVEEFIDGRELHVSVWGNGDEIAVLPAIEFDFSDLPEGHPRLISYEAKWDPLAEVYHRIHTLCPAPLPKPVRRRVQEVTIAAYRATGCRDYARLDLRLRRHKPYVLEVNPNPDLTESVSFMESAEVAGYSFSQALSAIVQMASRRRPLSEPKVQDPGVRR